VVDPASVLKKGEVYIDGKRYPLIGNAKVAKTVSSNFPPKRVEGKFTPESHPLISSVTWSDFQGGSGLTAITDGNDLTRTAELDRFQPTIRGKLASVPQKTATSTSGANGKPGALTAFSSSIYTNWTSTTASNLYRYDSTNDRWGNVAGSSTAAVLALGSEATDGMTGFVNSTEYMVFASSTSGIVWSDNATVWQSDTATPITYTAFHNNKLWGIHTNGKFFVTTTLSTSSTGANWTEIGKLNLPNGEALVTDLFAGPTADASQDRIYASSEIGPWVYDNANETWKQVLEVPYRQHAGKGTEVHRDAIYFPSGFELFPIVPQGEGTFIGEISPNKDGGTPVTRIGTFRKVLSKNTDISAFVSFDTGSTFEGSIYNWSERTGWYRSERTDVATQEITEHAIVSNAYSSYRMWFSNSTNSTGGKVYWTPLPTSVEPSYRGLLTPYHNSSMLMQLPNFDAGGSLQSKLALRAHIVVSSIDDTAGVIDVGYIRNTGGVANLESLGQVNSTGSSVFNFPNSTSEPTGSEFTSIQLQAVAQSSTSTVTVIESVTFEYVRRNPTLFQYDIPLNLRGSQRYGDRGSREMRADIDALLNSTAMVELRYTDDDATEERIYVLPQSILSADETGRTERSEATLRVTELIRLPATNQHGGPVNDDGFFLEGTTTSFILLEDGFFLLQE
jgi:hypothetical protein